MFRRMIGPVWWARVLRPLRRVATAVGPDPVLATRKRLAWRYLRGTGVEIGALHNPLAVPFFVRVRYIDRLPVADLVRQYPDLAGKPLVPVDVVADGETLAGVPNGSEGFVIANHFLEHCEDPIGAVKNFLRVLRPGGVAYLAVPDMRYTFDRERPLTPLAHLIADHRDGPAGSRRGHYEEYARLVHHRRDPAEAAALADDLMAKGFSIHFHVWTQREVLELLAHLRRTEPFDVEVVCRNGHEVVCILRKHAR